MKAGMFFVWMLWAAAAFTGCHAVVTMDADSGYDTGGDANASGNDSNSGVLTLTGAESGTQYEVKLFPYSSSAEKNADAWSEATATTLLSASGMETASSGTETASSGTAAITLKTPSGAAFNSTGTYLVLVSKSSGGESRYKAVVFRSGNAAIDLATTLTLPGTPTSSSISLDAPILHPFGTKTEGYTESARQPFEVTVENTGSAPTGFLTISLSGADNSAFILNRISIASIAAGGKESFTVMPRLGLAANEYIEKVTVSGNADIGKRDFEVSFTVNSGPTYGISLSTDRHTFPSMPADMTPPKLSVIVTNTGNRSTGNLTVKLSGADDSSFTVSPETLSIPAGGEKEFTVTPKSGLPKGTHSATVTVRGGANIGERALTVSFKVVDALTEGSAIVLYPEGDLLQETEGEVYSPEAYSFPVTIRNIGNVPTSPLTVTLLGPNASFFTVSPGTIPGGIPANGAVPFTVKPKSELPARTYKAEVWVDGDNIIPQKLDITFVVRKYGISLNDGITGDLGEAAEDYDNTTTIHTLNVTVKNIGNQPTGLLTVAPDDTDAFDVTPTTLDIDPGNSASFTVSPQPGLTVPDGSYEYEYNATVTVRTASDNNNPIEPQIFPVSFTVKKKYTVTFYVDGEVANYSEGVPYGDPAPEPTNIDPNPNPDYVLDGWYRNADGTGAAWNFATGTVTTDLDLYAYWIPPHTVTFYLNDGSASAPIELTVAHNTEVTPPASPPMRDDKRVFDNWFEEDATTPWDFDTGTVTANLQLYAHWLDPYIVTFDLNYTGAPVPDTQTVVHNEKAIEPEEDPIWNNYKFAGWYKEPTCETEWVFETDTVTSNLQLYANWNPRTFDAAIKYMAMTANRMSASYTLQSGSEDYPTAVTLTADAADANSPASVTIDGGIRTVTGGVTVDNDGKVSSIPLTVGAGVTLTLKNMTFSQIPFKVTAGGTLVLDDGSVIRGNQQHATPTNATNVSEVTGQFDGTGVYVDGGSLVMRGSSLITDNNHSGVQVFDGSFTMNGGTISNNRFAYAKFSDAAGWNGAGVGIVRSLFLMTGGVISYNTAPRHTTYSSGGYGGGAAVSGVGAVFTMEGGTISGNTADAGGGGVFLGLNATFYMSGNALISGNTATFSSGGGVDMSNNTTFNMDGGVIKSNKAGGEGGGVYASGNGNTRFNMTGGTIGGTAPADGNIAGLAPPPPGSVEGFYGGGVYLGNYVGAHMSGNPRVVSRDNEVNGGTGWTGLIEDYTNGSGPGLIQNNRPRNVQFSSYGHPYIP